ncbi:MAG: HAD-IIB family hydrolase [Cyanobacteria bacterium J06554_11]
MKSVSKLLVATDLDATLLDHQTYDFSPAIPVIEQLKSLKCPIIFNSSKTQSEQQSLRNNLNICDPFIIENGSAVVIPPGQLDQPAAASTGYTHVFGLAYTALIASLHRLREQHGYKFRGFADLTAAALAEITGLSLAGAAAAKDRQGSEPLLWEDSEADYNSFVAALTAQGLATTQGGRFRHVMGKTNKGKALTWLVDRYRTAFPQTHWTIVALGDSPNDVPMLQAADIGVLIPNPHRNPFEIPGVPHLIRAERPGPIGWAETVSSLLNTTQYDAIRPR